MQEARRRAIFKMNLILLSDSDFISPTRVRLTGRRLKHIHDILKAKNGQSLTVGKINGLMGQGALVGPKDIQTAIELEVKLDQKPPEALALTLILAFPVRLCSNAFYFPPRC